MTILKAQFAVVRPQIVGNAEEHELVCTSDGVRRGSAGAARRHGIRSLDHDDFWIAELDDGKLVQIRHSNGEVRTAATGDELERVAEALGVETPDLEQPALTYEQLVPKHGDCVIFLRKNGQACGAWINDGGDAIYQLPVEVTTDYDLEAEQPLTPRRFTVKAGRTVKAQKEWREQLNRETARA